MVQLIGYFIIVHVYHTDTVLHVLSLKCAENLHCIGNWLKYKELVAFENGT